MSNNIITATLQFLTITWLFIQTGNYIQTTLLAHLPALVVWLLWSALWIIVALILYIIDLRRQLQKATLTSSR